MAKDTKHKGLSLWPVWPVQLLNLWQAPATFSQLRPSSVPARPASPFLLPPPFSSSGEEGGKACNGEWGAAPDMSKMGKFSTPKLLHCFALFCTGCTLSGGISAPSVEI